MIAEILAMFDHVVKESAKITPHKIKSIPIEKRESSEETT